MSGPPGQLGMGVNPLNSVGADLMNAALGGGGAYRSPGFGGVRVPSPYYRGLGGSRNTAAFVSLGAMIAQGIYKASVEQQQQARAHANQQLASNKSIMKSVSSSNAKFIVTPGTVRNQETGETAPALMKMKLTKKSDGGYQAGDPKPIEPVRGRSGDIVTADGDAAVYLAP